ncbi:MAG TPA: dTDP-4-dehydrorhamnose 3,5-epimerase [Actinomycetota bacterium]|nr:dTDP-4-dehydrorhamnose 3,5-epimerase [Actinomycetota bacterium]
MRLSRTPLADAHIVDLDRIEDERGFFARSFDRRTFEEHGLNSSIAQGNLSFNRRRGTLRGMHYQSAPAAESKLIRCTRGAIHDVIIDLRPDSPTYCRHFGVDLTAENRRALYVPEMFGHGFQTLEDDTEVSYQVGEFYTPEAERGVRYDDPAFAIDWPLPISVISPKDASWPDFVR